jgi:uncharacterized protein (TIGR03067 family)
MKSLLSMNLALGIALSAAAASADGASPIDGNWVLTEAVANGQKMADASGELSAKEGEFEFKAAGNTVFSGTYQVDAAKKEIVFKDGKESTNSYGIYEISGSHLTVCSGPKKPSSIKSTPNSQVVCQSYKRK